MMTANKTGVDAPVLFYLLYAGGHRMLIQKQGKQDPDDSQKYRCFWLAEVAVSKEMPAGLEERQFLDTPKPEGCDRILHLALRLAEHRYECKDSGEDRAAGHSIDRGPVEPVTRHPGELECPHDQRDCKHQNTV